MINKATSKDAYRLMHYGILAFARAERQGFRVDIDQANSNKKELDKLIIDLTTKVENTKFYRRWKHSGRGKVDITNNFHLANYLYNILKLKPAMFTKGGKDGTGVKKGSTKEEALEALEIPELDDILQIRKYKKARDTYLTAFTREAVGGQIHPFFNLHLVVTYRSSSDSPNFQNIPVRDEFMKAMIRKCLYPRKDHQLAELDFKGIEVGVGTCYHKDPVMLKYITNDPGVMHTDMAKQIFHLDKFDKSDPTMGLLRSGAKNGFVFPQFYGDYYGNNAASLAKWAKLPINRTWKKEDGATFKNGVSVSSHLRDHKIKNLKGFTNHIKEIEDHFWNERFSGYNDWKKRLWRRYQKTGYIETLTGFRCGGVMSRNDVTNYPIQGAAFHCLLWCFTELDRIMRKEKWKTRLIGQIHDSIIFDIYPPELQHVMETAKQVTSVALAKNWPWIIVPLEIEAELCEVDESWYFKKEVAI